MKKIIVDLDGTLANIDHRIPLIRQKKKLFDKFYQLCTKDKMNEWCRSLIKAMVFDDVEVHIVSARPESLYTKTAQWLLRNGVSSEKVLLHLLRKDNDFTPDHKLKKEWLNSGVMNKEDILFVVDDRQRVVDMWRQEGLVCLQCDRWEEYREEKAPLQT